MTRSRNYAEIQPVEPEWLIPGWVQLGGVTYVAGDGGVGKSFLTADWAARVTRGLPMPASEDETPMPAGSVILVSAEDDPNMSMAYRLRSAGADLSRVYDMTDDFILPSRNSQGSLPGLRQDIDEIGDVRLVVIDPLAAVAGIPITSGNVNIRRYISKPLERFARDTGVAVVVIHHTVKSGRTAGSKAITDAARQVLKISRSSQDERIRVIEVDKTNVVSDSGGAIAYTLADSGTDTHVAYLALPESPDSAPREPTTREKILAALASEARKGNASVATQELCRLAQVDYTAGRVALTRGKHAGEVHSPMRGYWGLGAAETSSDVPALELVKS